MTFAEKLTSLIDNRGTNQSKLGRLTGWGQSTISAMTQGKRRPYLDQGLTLARTLGVSLDYLADDDLDEPPAPVLTEDERTILTVVRASGLDVETVVRAVMAFAAPVPEQTKAQTIHRDDRKPSTPSPARDAPPKSRTG